MWAKEILCTPIFLCKHTHFTVLCHIVFFCNRFIWLQVYPLSYHCFQFIKEYVLFLSFRVVWDALVKSEVIAVTGKGDLFLFYISMPRMSALIFLGAQRAAAHLMAGFHPLLSPAVHGCILPGMKGKLEMGPSFVLAWCNLIWPRNRVVPVWSVGGGGGKQSSILPGNQNVQIKSLTSSVWYRLIHFWPLASTRFEATWASQSSLEHVSGRVQIKYNGKPSNISETVPFFVICRSLCHRYAWLTPVVADFLHYIK